VSENFPFVVGGDEEVFKVGLTSVLTSVEILG